MEPNQNEHAAGGDDGQGLEGDQMNERILTMWPQVRMGGGKPCPECGSSTAERSQRVTASDLDERHQWWLTRHSCEGCGWAQDERAQGVSSEQG